jgi:hypothetical protein
MTHSDRAAVGSDEGRSVNNSSLSGLSASAALAEDDLAVVPWGNPNCARQGRRDIAQSR